MQKNIVLKLLSLGIITVILISCSEESSKLSISKDLMYRGEPIDPRCIGGIMFGDGGRFEPMGVDCGIKSDEADEGRSNELSRNFVAKGNYVELEVYREYRFENYSKPYMIHESYSYHGTYNEKQIVLSSYFDTSATGHFKFLGILKREGDTLINVGEIAGGDRGRGGFISNIELNGNLLKFEQTAQFDSITDAFLEERKEVVSSPMEWDGNLIKIAHLDEIDEHKQVRTEVVGVRLADVNDFEEHSSQDDLSCYSRMLQKYKTENSEVVLNLAEAKIFAAEFSECIRLAASSQK